MHSKTNKKKPSVGVELRAGEDPHRSEKPRWSACDMRQWPKQKKIADWFKANKMSFDLLKAVTMTIFIFFDLFKVSKKDYFNYELFKGSKSDHLIVTGSKSDKVTILINYLFRYCVLL